MLNRSEFLGWIDREEPSGGDSKEAVAMNQETDRLKEDMLTGEAHEGAMGIAHKTVLEGMGQGAEEEDIKRLS